MSDHYRLHGLAVRSEVPLTAPTAHDRAPDLIIRWGACRPVPSEPPAGQVVLDNVVAGRRWYVATRGPDGWLLRVPALCDFWIPTDLTAVECRRAPDADPGLVSVLVGGLVMAFVVTVRGHCVLHASAVATGEGALAFTGPAGVGKSTVAALLCASGARAITDDVLRVDLGEPARCFAGGAELRLRPEAQQVLEHYPRRPRTHTTADHRLAVMSRRVVDDLVPLRWVVIPRPTRRGVDVTVSTVPPAQAAFRLACFPRLLGWRDPSLLARQFDATVRLAELVPLAIADIPWGPPFRADLAPRLLELLGASAGNRP